ncbi:MAG: ABC transporter ATP-binding protein/permease [Clostridiales Family XIII bacterium]|jgi:ATP-binding cassette subfamily B protein|nr:ABC transporter ATP-binding protein/permease [Clostridiales Family XIII bacterium]
MAENTKTSRRSRMGGRGPGAMPTEKAKDLKGTIIKLFKYMSNYKWALLVVILFAAASTVFNVMGPKILGKAITELFTGLMSKYTEGGSINFDKIGQILLTLVILYVVASLFGMIQGFIMSTISQRTGYRLRKDVSQKISRLPMKYFESTPVGDILSRITNDIDTLVQSLNQALGSIVTSTCMVVGITIVMLTISPLLTLVVFLMLPLSLGFIGLIMSKSQKHFKNQQKFLGEVNGQVEECISGHNVVKLFNYEEEAKEKFKVTNDELFGSAWKSQFLSGLMQPIISFIGNFGYVCVAIFGAVLAFRGSISVGDIQSFIQYSRQFTNPIMQLAQVMNQVQSMAAGAERVFELLEMEDEIQDTDESVEIGELHGKVDFEHVHFGYDEDKIIINDFSEEVDEGKMVAIVGPTGAGKTTLVKLLMRFYDVNSGSILVDGVDLRNIKRNSLRENFGMVLQDTWLFKGTIMENIRYGRPDATDQEVYDAAKAAHVDHFIATLPGGYNMELSEDADNISQGQKQLLTIARAILADRPILILDEATSSVDTRTEEIIQKAMNNLKKGKTSFVIAHRLSTIRDADIIVVMKDGDIIEQGSHDELIAKGGFYADLYQSQFDKISA